MMVATSEKRREEVPAKNAGLLKFVGGKRQLLPEILKYVPPQFGVYWEPFVGGGAVFFGLEEAGLITEATLSDTNAKLIAMYQSVRDDVSAVIEHLYGHKNTKEHFLRVREDNMLVGSKAKRAADFIFLNRTCFNGVYRENKKGHFNVPFGDNPKAKFCDETRLRIASQQLKKATIREVDFEVILQSAKVSDLVFLDSPYAPLSKTSNFTAYDKAGFSVEDHKRLEVVFTQLASRGVYVILSASSAPLTYELYADRRDCRLHEVEARRSVNSKGNKRGAIKEVIVTNYRRGS